MADGSQQEHYNTLVKILNGSTNVLCQTLRRLWYEETEKEWDDTILTDVLGILDEHEFDDTQHLSTIAMGSKELEENDISVLSSAILTFPRLSKSSSQYDAVTSIYKINNNLVNNSSKKVSNGDFKQYMAGLWTNLTCLGMETEQLDSLIPAAYRQRQVKNTIENGKTIEEKLKAAGKEGLKKGTPKTVSLQLFDSPIDSYLHAKKKKHPVAAKYLADSYLEGENKDVAKAIKGFEETANMDPKLPGTMTLYKCNCSVAMAHSSLGHIYTTEEGYRDNVQAAEWLQKGMEYGDGYAACIMGLMYSSDEAAVKYDSKMAEMCFRESLNLKYKWACEYMVKHYLHQLEPEKANMLYSIWMAKEPQLLEELPRNDFIRRKNDKGQIRQLMKRQVVNLESEKGLDTKGHTFMHRVCRAVGYLYPELKNEEKVFEATPFFAHALRCFAPANDALNQNFKLQQNHDGSETETVSRIRPVIRQLGILDETLESLKEDKQYTEDELLQVLEPFYEILKTGLRLAPNEIMVSDDMMKIVRKLWQLQEGHMAGEQDEKLRVCYAMFSLFLDCDEEEAMNILVEGIKRYPNNCTYSILLCLHAGQKGNWIWGLRLASEGLKIDANNVELMFLETVFYSFLNADSNLDECVAKYRTFIETVPEDDPTVPDVWYSIAELHLRNLEREMNSNVSFREFGPGMEQVKEIFERGLEAEKRQLACFLPYRKSVVRLRVELALRLWEGDNNPTQTAAQNAKANEQVTPAAEHKIAILDKKRYLKSPSRIGLIKLHRQNIKKKREEMVRRKKKLGKKVESVDPPKLKQSLSNGLSPLRLITLLEMDPTTEHIFKDRLLQLTVLVEPFVNLGFLATVAEDEDGDVIRVHVYNFENQEDKFSVGSRIAVMCPYLSMTKLDSHSCIRIDDLRCVIFQRKVANMCGFCGEGDSSHQCSKCQRVYCSKECENLDVERHEHELICTKTVKKTKQ